MKIVGENYRDETRLEHMLAALLRIQATASNVSRDQLFLDDVATRALMYDFTGLFGEMWHGLWRHEVGVASQGGMTCLLFRSAA